LFLRLEFFLDDYVASAFKRRQMGAEIAVSDAEYGAKLRELDLVSMWQRIEGGNNGAAAAIGGCPRRASTLL
jgi:hypothetical protein